MMCLHYLLVVLVVLLGNFQGTLAEVESSKAPKENVAKLLTIEPVQVKPLTENYVDPIQNEESQDKPHEGKAVTKEVKVTDLHDPLNILDRLNKTDTIHSHSITSEDFAQVTSLVNMTSTEINPEAMLPKPERNEDEDNLSLLIIPVQDIPLDEFKSLGDLQKNSETTLEASVEDSLHGIQINTLNITYPTSNTEGSDKTGNVSVLHTTPLPFTEFNCEAIFNVSGESCQSLNFTELVRKVKDEIKTYSNDAMIAWEDLKEQVATDNEMSHVLKDYLDKITISQSVNKSECVHSHVDKYQSRLQFLKDVLRSCETNLKRENWLELQNRTKEILNSINEIVVETNLAKEILQKDGDANYENDENEGKRKLSLLGIESKKQELSDLKETSLHTDEDDYRDCITSNTGHEIIVDTLNDIMTIKNNCVG